MRMAYDCPVKATIEVLGGKWKIWILYHLRTGTKRFGELKRSIVGVTQQMLTMQLRELEADGVVRRTVYAEVPPRVEYALTPFGESLLPVLDQMLRWGERYLEHHAVAAVASDG